MLQDVASFSGYETCRLPTRVSRLSLGAGNHARGLNQLLNATTRTSHTVGDHANLDHWHATQLAQKSSYGLQLLRMHLNWLASLPHCSVSSSLRYSTTLRNGNPVNGNHLEICLLSSQTNRNSLYLGPGGLESVFYLPCTV